MDEDTEEVKKRMMKKMMDEDKGNSKEKKDYPQGPIKVTDGNFEETVNKYPIVLVDFWADWCGPCKMLEPVIEDLAEEYAGKVVFAKLNVDKNKTTSSRFGVSSIPTMILFKNGEPVKQMVGAQRKPQLSNIIDKQLE